MSKRIGQDPHSKLPVRPWNLFAAAKDTVSATGLDGRMAAGRGSETGRWMSLIPHLPRPVRPGPFLFRLSTALPCLASSSAVSLQEPIPEPSPRAGTNTPRMMITKQRLGDSRCNGIMTTEGMATAYLADVYLQRALSKSREDSISSSRCVEGI